MKGLKPFIKLLGNLYVSKKPMFVMWKPEIHKVKGYQIREVINCIQPGDILFGRHNGYLSSLAIPDFWSHAGLYVGNDKVIHAIGKGVVEEDILTFCRTDNIAVKRIKGVTNLMIAEAIKTAISLEAERLGYDYEYEDNNGTVYCTELVNICYGGIFNNCYVDIPFNSVLSPQGLYDSERLEKIVEFRNN